MAIEYRVYDPQKNEFFGTGSEHEEQAIGDADSLASLDHFQGELQVHKITDGDLNTAEVVHRVRG